MRSLNICTDGAILQEKANGYAKAFIEAEPHSRKAVADGEGLETTNNNLISRGWIDRFKVRHGICALKVQGETLYVIWKWWKTGKRVS